MNSFLKHIKSLNYSVDSIKIQYNSALLDISKVYFHDNTLKFLKQNFNKKIGSSTNKAVGSNGHFTNHKGPCNAGFIKDNKLYIEKCNVFYVHTSVNISKKNKKHPFKDVFRNEFYNNEIKTSLSPTDSDKLLSIIFPIVPTIPLKDLNLVHVQDSDSLYKINNKGNKIFYPRKGVQEEIYKNNFIYKKIGKEFCYLNPLNGTEYFFYSDLLEEELILKNISYTKLDLLTLSNIEDLGRLTTNNHSTFSTYLKNKLVVNKTIKIKINSDNSDIFYVNKAGLAHRSLMKHHLKEAGNNPILYVDKKGMIYWSIYQSTLEYKAIKPFKHYVHKPYYLNNIYEEEEFAEKKLLKSSKLPLEADTATNTSTKGVGSSDDTEGDALNDF